MKLATAAILSAPTQTYYLLYYSLRSRMLQIIDVLPQWRLGGIDPKGIITYMTTE
jgi:hypothetical protein